MWLKEIIGMDEKERVSRREFIKGISAIGIGGVVGSAMFSLGAYNTYGQRVSKVVIATDPNATSGMVINPNVTKQLVDLCVMQFTGQKKPSDAWASVIPSLSPKDLIAIKVNCINSALPSHREVVDAIVQGLISAGAKENNIIIWDRRNSELHRCGYKLNNTKTGVRCFGTDEAGWGYYKLVKVADKDERLSKILTSADHIINVPVLKNHNIAGVTLSMKNHYGSVDKPGSLHGKIINLLNCDPYIAELNNLPDIRNKTRLIVVDALLGIYKGGPHGAPQFAYNSIILGNDPVAVDYQGWKILEAEAQKHGRSIRYPKHIETAAKIGLGTNDPNGMKVEIVHG